MRLALYALAGLAFAASAHAAPEDFTTGPIIEDFGPVATVLGADPVAPETLFMVAFDVADAAEEGKANRRLETAARFLNMHGAAGVPASNMQLAIVVHGPASADLTNSESNASAPLIAALIDAGVSITLCGQTAAYRGIDQDDLLPGVTLSLSAMTKHAQLQQQGFTLNPF
jgi:intracellular sulfur oxidation DsrE/DsrF family protein